MVLERVAVTGLGLVTPLGCGVETVWRRLIQGASGIVRLLPDKAHHNLSVRIAGLVPEHSDELDKDAWWPRTPEHRAESRATVLALEAAEEAVADAGLMLAASGQKDTTGVAVGSGISDLEEIATTASLINSGRYSRVNPYFVPRILTNMPAGILSIKLGLRGPNHAVSTACTTGAHSIGDAANMIRLGMATAMLAGGTEACVNPISLAGFTRCRALANSYNERPTKASRPFDADREGFVMGEGAGILVLESMSTANARGARIYAELVGYGMSGDAFHLVMPDKDGGGAKLAMRQALGDVPPAEVGHVNAHATSTPAGDMVEAAAIAEVVGTQAVVASTKGALGHLLGAAGAVEAALTVLALHHKTIPPNLNLKRPESTLATLAPTHSMPFPPSENRLYALSNSFGFGGTNASLLFASPKQK